MSHPWRACVHRHRSSSPVWGLYVKIHVHTCKRAHACTHTHTQTRTHKHAHTHTHTHTGKHFLIIQWYSAKETKSLINTHTHTQKHTHTHTRTHTHTHTISTQACMLWVLYTLHIELQHTIHTYTVSRYRHTYVCIMHAYIHTYIHAYIHTYIHTFIHTYIHTCSPYSVFLYT